MSDLTGKTIGPYQILGRLGAGGMATVYRAYHAKMDRYVAIKVLPQHMAADPQFRARFEREARIIARLEHRHILPVHDVGESDDGTPYLVMRYSDAGTLSELLERGTLTLAQALEIVAQVGEALDYAHRQGVIHRDIKPANVLLDRDNQVLLTDFGIAKMVEGTVHQLTGEGAMLGTPFYMAPEQVRGQAADNRTDLYALGVILYESLTGRRPYMAETPLAVALMHVHDPLPPPRSVNPALPEPLELLLLRALAKEPEQRFQNAAEMVRAIRTTAAALGPAGELPAGKGATTRLPESAVPPAITPVVTPIGQAVPKTKVLQSEADAAVAPAAVADAAPVPRKKFLNGRWPVALAILAIIAAIWVVQSGIGDDGEVADNPTATVAATQVGDGTPPSDTLILGNTTAIFDLAARGDEVWAATMGGLVRWRADGTSERYTAADGLPATLLRTVELAPDGSLWVGGDGGVAHIVPAGTGLAELTAYTSEDGLGTDVINELLIHPDGPVLAGGSYNRPISVFENGRWSAPPFPLDAPELAGFDLLVTDMLLDRNDKLWVGLATDGLLSWDGERWARVTEADGIGPAPVAALAQSDDGTVWAALGDLGLRRLPPDATTWEPVTVPENAPVWAVMQLKNGNMGISSPGYVASSEDGGATWQIRGDQRGGLPWGLGEVAEDEAGRVWMATQDGLAVHDGSWRVLRREGELPFAVAGRLQRDPEDQLWAIEQYGGRVAVIDPESGAVSSPPFSTEGLRVTDVAWTDGTIWVAASNEDGGLVRIRDGARQRYTTEDGLPSNVIYTLLAYDDVLWVGTEAGLVAFYPEDDEFDDPVKEFEGMGISVLALDVDDRLWVGAYAGGGDQTRSVLGMLEDTTWTVQSRTEGPTELSSGITAIASTDDGTVWVATWNHGLWSWDDESWRRWNSSDGAPEGNVLALVAEGEELWAAGQFGDLYLHTPDGWSTRTPEAMGWAVVSMVLDGAGRLWIASNSGVLVGAE